MTNSSTKKLQVKTSTRAGGASLNHNSKRLVATPPGDKRLRLAAQVLRPLDDLQLAAVRGGTPRYTQNCQ